MPGCAQATVEPGPRPLPRPPPPPTFRIRSPLPGQRGTRGAATRSSLRCLASLTRPARRGSAPPLARQGPATTPPERGGVGGAIRPQHFRKSPHLPINRPLPSAVILPSGHLHDTTNGFFKSLSDIVIQDTFWGALKGPCQRASSSGRFGNYRLRMKLYAATTNVLRGGRHYMAQEGRRAVPACTRLADRGAAPRKLCAIGSALGRTRAPEVGSGPAQTLWRVGRQRRRGEPAAAMAADSHQKRGKAAAGAAAIYTMRLVL